jgi:dTDP-4-dehydrorhamnose reductase
MRSIKKWGISPTASICQKKSNGGIMKALFTGMNGTVSPIVANFFKTKGYEIIPYDRSKISVTDYAEIKKFILNQKPDIILHFAMGTPEWSGLLAKIAKEMNIKFVFISTVSVYASTHQGPLTIHDVPDALDEYGKYKRISEQAVLKENSKSYILRLGWQIGNEAGSNEMIGFLTKQMAEYGVIKASSKWYPSCSFMEDSALSIYEIVHTLPSDTYLINSNTAYTFFEICVNLTKIYKDFIIEETEDFIQDFRMFDERVPIRKPRSIFND